MDYDTRMSAVKNWLRDDILPRFTAPSNVDKAVAANDVAQAVNANVPRLQNIELFKSYLNDIAKHVTQAARSRTLPVPKDFIEACREVTKRRAVNQGVTTNKKVDTYSITEKRVRAKEAISSSWLTEIGLQDLMSNTSLTLEDMQPYIDAHKHNISGENNEQNGIHRW